ncbi:MAG: TonB-dependent receptor [Bacteroidales bacterium]|nr:TonB-dependent receptor [Bacteroidales bacterium]MDD3664188.1 TonB-dependent receptor [Bacteroidales bacterium]
MKLFVPFLLPVLVLMLYPGGLVAQKVASPAVVKVVDATTGSPVAFAHVCFENEQGTFKQYVVTGLQGEASCVIPSRCVVAVSFVGYSTLYDTINSRQSKVLKLEPIATAMDEVVVTAQFTPQRADKSIYAVRVISSKQIEAKAASNLGDLLRGEAGIRTTNDGVLGSSISVQGLSGENVKFLIDGIPVIGRMNGNIDLGQLNLGQADHVEIIEGPMSVVYGSNALAGVVNIITRQNQTDKYWASANAYAESVGVFNADGGAGFSSGKHTLQVSGGRNFFGGYSDPDTSRADQWKPKRQVFADGSWFWGGHSFKTRTSVQFFDEKLLNRGNLIAPYYENAFDSEFLTRRWVVRNDISWQPTSDHSFSLLSAWSGFDRRKTTWYNDLTTLHKVLSSNADDQDTTVFGMWNFRGTWSRKNDRHWLNWQTGFDLNIEDGSGKRIDGHEQSIGDYAAFASLLFTPHPVLELQPGLRLAYNSRYNSPPVYSVNLKWMPADLIAVRASAATGFRAPSLKELYLYFVDVNHNIRGNSTLDAETSTHFNLSFQYSKEKSRYALSTSVSAFYNDIHNIITLAEQEKQLFTYVNVDKFRTVGGKLQTTVRFFPRLSLSGAIGVTGRSNSLSLQHYTFTTDVSGEVTYHWLRSNVQLTTWYKYTGRLPQLQIDANGNLYESFVDGYHLLDGSVSKGLFNNRLSVAVGVKNLFNVRVVDADRGTSGVHSGGGNGQLIAWGRTWFVKCSFKISQKN